MARLLLGVSGGIAAYKALELVRLATKAGHSVRVIQTPTSERFVGVASFEGITGAPVLTSEFARDPLRGAFPGDPLPEHEPISHLQLVANADAFLIAPASANTIAKLAHGLADNLLTSAALAARCPLVVAPAMNDAMYEHPATQANLALLRERGVRVVDPGIGPLASKGEHGIGRLAEPPELLAACEAAIEQASAHAPGAAGSLAGLRVLVTAGGTREPIDSVRYVGNRSSGRMGYALAEQAARRGAAVTVIAANVSLPAPRGVDGRGGRDGRRARATPAPRRSRLRRAADGGRGRRLPPGRRPPPRSSRRTRPMLPTRSRSSRTPDVLAGLAAARRPRADGRRLRRRARRGRPRVRAREARAQAPRRDRRQRHLARRHRLRRRPTTR